MNENPRTPLPPRADPASGWSLAADVVYLNHGSFGACPRAIRDRQRALQMQMDAQPVQFMVDDLPALLDRARGEVATFLGADPAGLAFVANATEGVNTALHAAGLQAGDDVLIIDQAYPACRRALEQIAASRGARVVTAALPFPLADPAEVVERVLAAVTPRTRLALIDHVTSPTGLVLPVDVLVPELETRGIATLVDGAHAPGMLPLNLDRLGASWYTGNFHKWLCAPVGAAMLWTREDRRPLTRPLALSHAAGLPADDPERHLREFDWTGTRDFTPWLVLPDCIEHLSSLHSGGLDGWMAANRALALQARDLLVEALGIQPPAPDAMIGSLAAVPLPPSPAPPATVWEADPLQRALRERWSIEVPVFSWPAPPSRVLRVSAQGYNSLSEYSWLEEALLRELALERAR